MSQISLPLRQWVKIIFRWLLAVFFVLAGTNHFLHPAPYLTMMPSWLPNPRLLIQISGVGEVLGGLGVLFPFSRRLAGWGLIALLVAIFPANLNVALHGWPGVEIAAWVLWVRLPFQAVFVAWVYWTSNTGSRP
jgi:uncharacterized membrane protein